MFLTLYKSPVRPHSEYCKQRWSPYHIGLQDRKVQRRDAKIVPNLKQNFSLNNTGESPVKNYRRRVDDLQAFRWKLGDYGSVISDTAAGPLLRAHAPTTLLSRRMVVDIIDGH